MVGKWTRHTVWAAVFACMAAGAGASLPSTVYVKADNTRVRSGRSASDPVLATLSRGTPLDVQGKVGARYEVTVKGRKGYVSRLKVSTTEPRRERAMLSGLGTSGIGASERESVASLRGLSPVARKLAQAGQADPRAVGWVEKMEAMSSKVTRQDVEGFLNRGGVGH